MVENIEQIQAIANGLGTESLASTMISFSNALNGLESYINNQEILDLISQIYFLVGELSQVIN